ncbi:MAG: ATP-binding protein [bacterium]|nr:ATP-binding protein [bacterium]
MASFNKQFTTQYILRVVLLSVTIGVWFWLFFGFSNLFATLAAVGVLAFYQIYALLRYVEKTNRNLARFLMAIKHADFSQSFTSPIKGAAFDDLNAAFQAVAHEFQRTRLEKEEHFRYLQTIVDHVGVALIAFSPKGGVELFNNASKRLLHRPHVRHITQLDAISPELSKALFHLKIGGHQLLQVPQAGSILQLSMYATGFVLRRQEFKLVSIQNIANALDDKEIDAWQKLIRILTHEIVNSITPIASLASTANDLLTGSHTNDPQEEFEEILDDIREAVGTIEKRSKGLLDFVDNYRKLTRIPSPDFSVFPVHTLFRHIESLMQEQAHQQRIDFRIEVDPDTLELTADQMLLAQVLINLCKNAFEAVRAVENPEVLLRSVTDEFGRAMITISDNGPGLEESITEKVFIPFFTTKPHGSGIRLSLSRQILRLHNATLNVRSVPGEHTTFTIRFL